MELKYDQKIHRVKLERVKRIYENVYLTPSLHDFKLRNNRTLGVNLMRLFATYSAVNRLNKKVDNDFKMPDIMFGTDYEIHFFINNIHIKKLFPNLPFRAKYPKYRWFENYTEYQPILTWKNEFILNLCDTVVDGDFHNWRYYDDLEHNDILKFSKAYLKEHCTKFILDIINSCSTTHTLLYIDTPQDEYKCVFTSEQWNELYDKNYANKDVVLLTSRYCYNNVIKSLCDKIQNSKSKYMIVDDHYIQLYIMSKFNDLFVCNTSLGFIAGRYFEHKSVSTVSKWFKEMTSYNSARIDPVPEEWNKIYIDFSDRDKINRKKYVIDFPYNIGVKLKSSEGIGSMMFSIAAAASMAKNNNVLFTCVGDVIPAHMTNDNNKIQNIFPSVPFPNMLNSTNYNSKLLWEHRIHQHASSGKCSEIKYVPKCELNGYFKSMKYFEENREYIKELFTFSEEIKKQGIEYLKELRENYPTGKVIFVHIRRGDYVEMLKKGRPVFAILDKEYYKNALEAMNILINEKQPVITKMSDVDKEKGKMKNDVTYILFYQKDEEFVEEIRELVKQYGNVYDANIENGAVTMYVMSQLSGGIIANSNLSWWGAYLNDNIHNNRVMNNITSKKTQSLLIAPYDWYHEDYQYYPYIRDVKLIPDNWGIV